MTKTDTLVIGIGNEFRSDDAVGILAARNIKLRVAPNVRVVEMFGEGASLIEEMKTCNNVYIVDAVSSGADPGTIHRLDAIKHTIPTGFFNYSTHAFSLAEAIETSRILGKLPEHCIIYGIEGGNFDSGQELSTPVVASLSSVCEEIEKELNA